MLRLPQTLLRGVLLGAPLLVIDVSGKRQRVIALCKVVKNKGMGLSAGRWSGFPVQVPLCSQLQRECKEIPAGQMLAKTGVPKVRAIVCQVRLVDQHGRWYDLLIIR